MLMETAIATERGLQETDMVLLFFISLSKTWDTMKLTETEIEN